MKLIEWQVADEVEAYTVTRLGGYSQGEHASMNLSFSVNDDPEIVMKNREALASYLHTDLNHMIALSQTHSTNIKEIKREDAGKGMHGRHPDLYNYDACYTKERGIFLMTFHADCTPVLLYCPDIPLVCAIHSGWKGNVSEITYKSIQYLIEHEHINPTKIHAYIGPSIEFRNFEVGQDVIDLVNAMHFDASDCYKARENKPGKYLFDGKKLVKKQLLLHNVKEENITISPYCTIENNDLFYSYRVEKLSGRNATMIKLK